MTDHTDDTYIKWVQTNVADAIALAQRSCQVTTPDESAFVLTQVLTVAGGAIVKNIGKKPALEIIQNLKRAVSQMEDEPRLVVVGDINDSLN